MKFTCFFLTSALLLFSSGCGGNGGAPSEPMTDFPKTTGDWTAKKLICKKPDGKRADSPLPMALTLSVVKGTMAGTATFNECHLQWSGRIETLTKSQIRVTNVSRLCSPACDPTLCKKDPKEEFEYRMNGSGIILIQPNFMNGCDPGEIHFVRN